MGRQLDTGAPLEHRAIALPANQPRGLRPDDHPGKHATGVTDYGFPGFDEAAATGMMQECCGYGFRADDHWIARCLDPGRAATISS